MREKGRDEAMLCLAGSCAQPSSLCVPARGEQGAQAGWHSSHGLEHTAFPEELSVLQGAESLQPALLCSHS